MPWVYWKEYLRMKSGITISAIVALCCLAGCTTPTISAGELGSTRETSVGAVLVDSQGMTVYTYDEDEPGKSNCTGVCAVIWPPVEAAQGASPSGQFTLVDRGNSTKQWAYDGMPLYGYFFDDKPGDVSGDGADGVWHVIHP
jgi:predicted lipoprotein with Yx(FWY)xxD motif